MINDTNQIAIYGAGGFGREVAQLLMQINEAGSKWDFIGYFDDNRKKGEMVNGHPIIGNIEDLNSWSDNLYLVFALGIPTNKINVLNNIKNSKIKYPVLIHPSAIVGTREFVEIGEGSIVCAGNILTTNITIGKHVIINLSCTIGHDVIINDYSSLMPTCNISGKVVIGEMSFIGTGTKIINNINIGEHVIIGAGAVVTSDIPNRVTAVGVPAKVIKNEKF
ncbi:MAG: acetyltransferase [Pseudomonadota bacterium]